MRQEKKNIGDKRWEKGHRIQETEDQRMETGYWRMWTGEWRIDNED